MSNCAEAWTSSTKQCLRNLQEAFRQATVNVIENRKLKRCLQFSQRWWVSTTNQIGEQHVGSTKIVANEAKESQAEPTSCLSYPAVFHARVRHVPGPPMNEDDWHEGETMIQLGIMK